MKNKNADILKILTIVLPFAVALGMLFVLAQNYIYNNKLRSYDFSPEYLSGGVYEFPEVSVEITPRGGDSGSWIKGAVYDDDRNIISEQYVGTIYEMKVTNKTGSVMSDWEATIYMPEDLLLNNSWNGELEIHQTVSGEERIQSIDLADYSEYDITLDYYMDASGPMVPMKEGDFFVYHPDPDIGEMPINASDPDNEDGSSVRMGFITYIRGQPVDYEADFSRVQFRFHLKANVFKNPLFWIIGGLFFAWLVCLLSLIVVRINLKRFMEQKERDEQIIEQTMRTFVNFIEAKDPSTMGHSLRVALYSKLLAESLDFSMDDCKRIYYIALMHDCGKIYIPDKILTKPSKLTDEEYAAMKKHTVYGSEILRDFTSIKDIQLGAMYHHERYDGKGYPSGIAGEDIPVIARIICVSDAFDAMNSQRCYRSSLTPEAILKEIRENRGTQFDPAVADALLKLIDEGKVNFGTSVKHS